jgi:V/A-type H+/Na+-transporting ATPase subunit F
MRIRVIGHSEAVLGFFLVGVHGQVATSAEEVNQALDDALASPETGIILVTEEVARLIEPRMTQLKLHSTVPLIAEIPGPDSSKSDQPSLNEVVQRAIGIKM